MSRKINSFKVINDCLFTCPKSYKFSSIHSVHTIRRTTEVWKRRNIEKYIKYPKYVFSNMKRFSIENLSFQLHVQRSRIRVKIRSCENKTTRADY